MDYTVTLTDSYDQVTLYPDFDHDIKYNLIETKTRSQAGKLFRYKWADYLSLKFDFEAVPSSSANIINQWHKNNTTPLYLIIPSSCYPYLTEGLSVSIMGDESPFSQMDKPYLNYFKGTLNLEAV